MIILFFLPLLFILGSAQSSNKCRALALQGGGDAGSWQAGVIAGLIANLPAEEVQYDVISGVSVGAINGLYVSTYSKGEEQQMASELIALWTNLTRDQVYVPWDGTYLSVIRAFFDKPSLLDNSPAKKYLANFMENKEVKRKISIGITDYAQLHPVVYDLDQDWTKENITNLVVDSASIPFFFPYRLQDNSIYVDGGVLLNLNIHSAVRRCTELGFDQKDIVMTVILPDAYGGGDISNITVDTNYTGWYMYQRYQAVQNYKTIMDDLIHAFFDFKDVEYKYIIIPETQLPSMDNILGQPVLFEHDQMVEMIQMGINDAKAEIANPKFRWWEANRNNEEQIIVRPDGTKERSFLSHHEEGKDQR